MPFYIRNRARYPLWLPPAVGAGLILVISLTRGFAGGVLPALLQVLMLALFGALVVGGFYFGYNVSQVRSSLPLRWLLSAVAVLAFLATLTLALTRADGALQWNSVARSSFLGSTSLLSVLLGWVIARDLFGLSPATDRVYLTPAEFNALPAAEQAKLKPE